ncbi:Nucleotide-binding universal stress protein, UspA family [Lentzea waywayandensis]|uniref:Nucleotide-binding universal stress protein, UspA family n=1 Tax=Lentzea waywayandensis TaxID=84724 RepID=A0A1I6D9C5_9PSEU|nr:universal stress protein [Lentzea waywayandensis]SFR02008.1 Nucleotide-binding universal stress protein, UspA family [Lentzea waywayandensis]
MNDKSRIVVGVDGSPAARGALAWAVAEAKRTNASVLALSVCQLNPSLDEGIDPFSEQHRHDLEAAVESLGPSVLGVRIDTEVPQGVAGPVLVARSADAAYLVVGEHGSHRADLLVMSSVTSYCLRHALCPVVVVPLEGAHHDGPLMLRPEPQVR